jgi:anti-anti-sigma factor
MPHTTPHKSLSAAMDSYVTVTRDDICMVVAFQTDIDMDIMIRIRPFLTAKTEKPDRAIIVDLARVGFLDSAAVSLLAHVFHATQKTGKLMFIAAAQDQPAAVLDMVGLSAYVPLVPDTATAKAALKGIA